MSFCPIAGSSALQASICRMRAACKHTHGCPFGGDAGHLCIGAGAIVWRHRNFTLPFLVLAIAEKSLIGLGILLKPTQRTHATGNLRDGDIAGALSVGPLARGAHRPNGLV